MDIYYQRLQAVRRYLSGEAVVKICKDLGRSFPWFYKWWNLYKELGPEGLKSHPPIPHKVANKTSEQIEQAIIKLRKIKETRDSDSTENKYHKYALIGAASIRRELEELGFGDGDDNGNGNGGIPAITTINNILKRNNLIKQPNSKEKSAWNKRDYPTPEAHFPNEVHQLDLVGPWYLNQDSTKHYFAGIKDVASLAVNLDACSNKTSKTICDFTVQSWQTLGIPRLLQLDNGLEFRGSNRYPRSFGLVIRLALLLKVEVLFVPERNPWRNGSIENFNGLFQRLLMKAQQFSDFSQVKVEIPCFLYCCNHCHPHEPIGYLTSQEFRDKFPDKIRLLNQNFAEHKQLKEMPISEGKVSFIRQVRRSGRITILTEKFDISPDLAYEYVYATIFTGEEVLRVFHKKELIKEFKYTLPKKH